MSLVLSSADLQKLGYTYIDRVLGAEGGYVNHPSDRGGPTIWGVTEKTARGYGYAGPMQQMTRQQAIMIYTQLFWQNRFDKVAATGLVNLAYAMLDFGVNSGNGRPAEAMQRILNVSNRRGKSWPDLKVDGGIGPITLSCLKAAVSVMGTSKADSQFSFHLTCLRVAFITNLAESDEKQEDFVNGWVPRMFKVAEQTYGKDKIDA